jgi:ketosteroid isomerase-like protein
MLRKEFGVRFMPFFDLYGLLHNHLEGDGGAPPPEGWAEAFRTYSRLIYTTLSTDAAKTEFASMAAQLRPLLNRLDEGVRDRGLGMRLADSYARLLQAVARDRGVFLSGKPVGRWTLFRVMSEKEQKLEQLRTEDPELYDTVMKSREVMRTVDAEIQRSVAKAGLLPSRKSLLGKPVHIGTDPVTGEEVVYDDDGSVLPVGAYVEKRKADLRAQRAGERVFPRDLNQLRRFSDEELEGAMGDVQYVSLTDDKAKSNALTRIYPTKLVGDTQVVVEGRFKGFAVPDLVNAAGRLIEGTAYDFDVKTGRPIPLETKNPDGSVNVKVLSREPYVTLDRGQLLLRLPSTREYTQQRRKIAELARLIPSLKYVEGSRKSLFTFDPKDFAAVREALGGMALSTAASKRVKDHFTELARHEMAAAEENLQDFTAENIGGFRPNVKLLTKQKQALAWMESRGRSGVIALDTGVGKTATTIAAIQKMQRDGLAEPGTGNNGKYLYVCPTSLRGNLAKEAHKFMVDPKAFIQRVEVMTYRKFYEARKRDPSFGEDFVAVFFDEAQALKNPKSEQAKAAMTLNHQRKVLLTASPMERSPMEVYALAAISNNVNLNTREARAEARAFRARFAEEVGGRIMGMKDDPITARDMRVWVKQNLYFADKRAVEELNMKELVKQTDTVTMAPEVEAVYRETAQQVSGVLSGLVSKYRDRTVDKTTQNRELESARIKLAGLFSLLTELANRPDKVVPGAKNTKLDRLVQIMDEKAGSQSRVIVFTDSPGLAEDAVALLSQRCPWKSHAVALANRIEVVGSTGERVAFTEKQYKRTDGTRVPKKEWKTHVLQEIVAKNPQVGSVVLTSSYAVGQNLQQFDTVVHLDRDTWNSETMKQRTARAWRQGQENPVTEVILDTVYENPLSDTDATLDQIRRYVQELDSDLFDRVVIESQTEALGSEFFGMKRTNASFYKVNRRMMEMAMSPYLAQLKDM